jgi:hypothetical protein
MMRTFQTPGDTESLPFLGYQAATEPVGGVSSSIPLHPDDHPPDFNERKRKIERKPTRDNPGEDAGNKPPDPDHQIDEYA